MEDKVGVIGLGAMGGGMARSLRRAGCRVHVVDVRPGVAEAFAAEGGVACASPAELASLCDVIVSVVINAAQTETVLFGDGRLRGRDAARQRLRHVLHGGSGVVGRARVAPRGTRHSLPGCADLRRRGQGGLGPDHDDDLGPARGLCKNAAPCSTRWPRRSTDWATAPAPAARSRSSTSCWPACTSRPPPKRWRWGCAKAWTRRRCTKSSRTARATAGCSRTAWPMCWPATTRRCPPSTSSSRTWGSCSTWRAPASFRCRCRPPRTRCSCRHPARASPRKTTAP